MQNLKLLSDSELLSNTRLIITRERELTTEILWHLREIECRRLYAAQGYASLFDYATRGLGYCEGSAGRRIAAMRLLKDLPDIEPALKSGALSLSNASALQYFFKNEERNKNRSYSQGEKVKLVEGLAGRSRRECEVILAGLSPDAARAEKSRPISATQTELRITVGQELLEKLEKLKGLLSHRNPSPSMAELILMLADIALKQLDPDQKQSRKPTRQSKEPVLPAVLAAGPAPTLQLSRTTPPAECKRDEKVLEKSRYIPQSLRKAVWTRDHGQCTYLNPQTGVPCNSRHQIEIHHLKEFSLGGRHTLENTTLRCRPHNLHAAIETFGAPYMNQFLKVQTETFL